METEECAPYYYDYYPYQEYILTNYDYKNLPSISGFNKELISPIGEGENLTIFIREMNSKNTIADGHIIFSGVAKVNSKLVWGYEDIDSTCKGIDFVNCVGNYSAIIMHSDSILISNDYFGTDKTFYFQDGSFFIISNRYHLLLIALHELGVTLTVSSIVDGYLSMSDITCDQLMTDDTFADQVKVVPYHKNLRIDTGLKFVDSKISEIISDDFSVNDEEYDILLDMAKSEFEENIKICFHNPRFNSFIVDVTGGMDSRMVFATLASIPGSKKIVRAFTFGKQKEIECAANIVNAMGFEYDPNYQKVHSMGRNNHYFTANMSPKEYFEIRNSTVTGQYFEPGDGLTDSNVVVERTLRFTGGVGEMISRPYVAANVFKIDLNSNNLDDAVSKYIERKKHTMYIPENSESLEGLINSSVKSSLSSTVIKKCETILHQRTRYHFDTKYANMFRTPVWEPCQSINAFKAYYGTISRFNSRRFIYNLIERLNPSVSCFEYLDEINNREFELHSSLILKRGDRSTLNYRFSNKKSLRVKNNEELNEEIINSWKNFDIPAFLKQQISKFSLYKNGEIQRRLQNIINNPDTSIAQTVNIYRKLQSTETILRINKGLSQRYCYYSPKIIKYTKDSIMEDNRELYEKAESGCVISQHRLGIIYKNHQPPLVNEAEYWLAKASRSGIPYICNDLSQYLIEQKRNEPEIFKILSNGVDYDNDQSIRWLGKYLELKGEDKLGRIMLRYSELLGNPWIEKTDSAIVSLNNMTT